MPIFKSLIDAEIASAGSTAYEPVLNPRLYAAMKDRFGAVRVVNDGEPLTGTYGEDANGPRLEVHDRGETYVTCCPFCGDSRDRMWINHMFGVYDYKLQRRHYELWKCYNSECQQDYRNTSELADDLVYNYSGSTPSSRLAPTQTAAPKELTKAEFPGPVVPVNALEPDHPASVYLAERRFDRDYLYKTWGVVLCTDVEARTKWSLVRGRLVVPVVSSGVMVGYQARFVGDIDWKKAGVPKYLTYFPKSRVVYGIDEAENHPYLVLVEGATDVWRYGRGAVATFGKTSSQRQVAILAARLNGRTLILVPDNNDPDSLTAFIETAKDVTTAQRNTGVPVSKVALCVLPTGRDAGSMTCASLWSAVAKAAAHPVV